VNAPDRESDSSRADALRSLANRVRGEVRLGTHDRMLYSTDASIYQREPMGVVVPADRDDAADAVRACHELGLPVLPRGGGTSLAGQCVNEAVVIDVSPSCRGVRGIDRETRSCHAEAGISVTQLNAALAQSEAGAGLFFAPDPATATHATIGGCIGNNAAGSRSILYGRTSESVLGVEVCLADGRRVTLEDRAGARDPVARDLAERVIGGVRRPRRPDPRAIPEDRPAQRGVRPRYDPRPDGRRRHARDRSTSRP
jgi:FAD/FMN-containing dehydrogenase